MSGNIVKRLGNLLSVKSLVTLTLTVVFAVMALRGTISQDFMTVYAVLSRKSNAAANSRTNAVPKFISGTSSAASITRSN